MHVICPLEFERSRLARAAQARGWIVHCSGPGRIGIEHWATTTPLPAGSTVILAGVAGGLKPSALSGMAVTATIILDESGDLWHPRCIGTHTLSQTSVRCLSAETMLQTPAAKAAAAARWDADIVDMESAAFARIAESAGWHWGVVRGISDGCTDALPEGVEQWTDTKGGTRIGAVLGTLARHPTRLPQLMALARRSGAAMRAVEQMLAERF